MQDARRASHGGLPSPGDLFVGRDGELVAVSGMLADARARLVTLTGPPGIGKTRLALACASAYAERSQCPPVFVDLAPVRDPALVMAELAQAAGVEPRSGADLTGQLAAALGNEERLVVLDNFEHLLDAAPDLGQVLAACPRLRVLADDPVTAMRAALAQNGAGPGYRKVPRGGAGRAAARIAALLAGQ